MDYLVLDAETIRNPDVKWEAKNADDFPPVHCHQIVALSRLLITEDDHRGLAVAGPIRHFGVEADDEEEVLCEFASFMTRRPRIITFNGRSFDLPVIEQRLLRHGLPCPQIFDKWYRARYTDGHIDMIEELSNWSTSRRPSLDNATKSIGLPGKASMDGSDVASLYKDGRLDDIVRYCYSDTYQTALLWIRHKLIRGELPLPAYRKVAESLLKGAYKAGAFPELDPVKQAIVLLKGKSNDDEDQDGPSLSVAPKTRIRNRGARS